MDEQQASLVKNIEQVRQRMRLSAERAGRKADQVRLVAVSKTINPEMMLQALALGIDTLAENRVQEARDKWPTIESALLEGQREFHLVGHLQTNKAKEAARLFDLIQSLDSIRLAKELDQRAGEIGKVQRVLIEVNTSQELTKFGVEPSGIEALMDGVRGLRHLRLEGLMTIGPLQGGSAAARSCFRQLRNARELLGGKAELPELSMGMTQDFEIAIEEGATMVRIGTAIFGSRN